MSGLLACLFILYTSLASAQEETNACRDAEGDWKCEGLSSPSQGCWLEASPFMDPEAGTDCCPWEVCGRDCFDEETSESVSAGTRFVITSDDGSARDCRCVANQETGDSNLECVVK